MTALQALPGKRNPGVHIDPARIDVYLHPIAQLCPPLLLYQDGVVCLWDGRTGALLLRERHQQHASLERTLTMQRSMARSTNRRSTIQRNFTLGRTTASAALGAITESTVALAATTATTAATAATTAAAGCPSSVSTTATAGTKPSNGGTFFKKGTPSNGGALGPVSRNGVPAPVSSQAVVHVAFSPSGTLLATCSKDGTVRAWDVEGQQAISVALGHAGPVTCVSFSPDGRTLVSCGADGTVRGYQMTEKVVEAAVPGPEEEVSAVAVVTAVGGDPAGLKSGSAANVDVVAAATAGGAAMMAAAVEANVGSTSASSKKYFWPEPEYLHVHTL